MFGKALGAEPPVPKKFILYLRMDSMELVPDSEALIPEIIDCIRDRNSFDIRINGHSDRAGSDEYNFALSLNRAHYVRDLLVKSGIDEAFITTTSHGEGNPLVPTKDGVPEPRNRRVEVIVR
jgi:outer membrane protein OmpA-like peptidoglycan-associated protein